MDRDQILAKARYEKDEMEVQVKDKSMKVTYIVLVLTAAVFAFIRGMNDQPVMDLCATVCYSVFAGRIYCYVKTKNRFDLIMAVITIVTALVATYRFWTGH